MRISMMRPMPFWPSFEPCAQLTPVQVNTNKPRINSGGGRLPSGSLNNEGIGISVLAINISKAAALNPINGENSNDCPIFAAWLQSTPLVPVPLTAINWFMRPTPMMEPINVWELEDGRPKYHVPRFQRMAAISSANTMAKPAPLPTCRISSTGRNDTMPNATAPLDTSTPKKLKKPDQTTAKFGDREFV